MPPTIQQVIDTILHDVTAPLGSAPLADTVDTFKSGDTSRQVTGIVTTFMATHKVIEEAIRLGANLIITHEPTYYNHLDETAWLEDDPVYQTKRQLLDEHGVTVWRFHDHWHIHRPDGILTGFVRRMGWESFQEETNHMVFVIPETTLGELAQTLKNRFEISTLRFVGELGMPCSRVGVSVGGGPGVWQINLMQREAVEVVICGETSEWQVCEYIRDAVHQGLKRSLIILGHERSEEPGMQYLVEWLRPRFPGVPIAHIPSGDPLQFT